MIPQSGGHEYETYVAERSELGNLFNLPGGTKRQAQSIVDMPIAWKGVAKGSVDSPMTPDIAQYSPDLIVNMKIAS